MRTGHGCAGDCLPPLPLYSGAMETAVTDLPIIILAAGQSDRMRGTDKLMEHVEGLPLIRRQAEMARKVTRGKVIIALPPAPHARYDVLGDLNVMLLPVPDADEGMNASLRCAVKALPPGSGAAMIVLADLPELTADDLRTVFQSVDLTLETVIWRGATRDGHPGHPIVFAASQFDALLRLCGDSGGRGVVASAGHRVALVALPDQHARRDLDTPEDWAAWRGRT